MITMLCHSTFVVNTTRVDGYRIPLSVSVVWILQHLRGDFHVR